jgi:hypothetical protein
MTKKSRHTIKPMNATQAATAIQVLWRGRRQTRTRAILLLQLWWRRVSAVDPITLARVKKHALKIVEPKNQVYYFDALAHVKYFSNRRKPYTNLLTCRKLNAIEIARMKKCAGMSPTKEEAEPMLPVYSSYEESDDEEAEPMLPVQSSSIRLPYDELAIYADERRAPRVNLFSLAPADYQPPGSVNFSQITGSASNIVEDRELLFRPHSVADNVAVVLRQVRQERLREIQEQHLAQATWQQQRNRRMRTRSNARMEGYTR